MTPEQLYLMAIDSISVSEKYGVEAKVQLLMKKKPKEFPSGELLSETDLGKVYNFKAKKIIEWLQKNNLIDENNT